MRSSGRSCKCRKRAYAMSNKGAFYGISKLTSEKVVEEYAKRNTMSYVVLRYGSIYGPVTCIFYQVIKEVIQSEKIIHHGDGEEIREYVHVHDVSTLSVEVIEDRSLWSSCLMLTGSERLKRKDLFNMIKEILDKKNVGDSMKPRLFEPLPVHTLQFSRNSCKNYGKFSCGYGAGNFGVH